MNKKMRVSPIVVSKMEFEFLENGACRLILFETDAEGFTTVADIMEASNSEARSGYRELMLMLNGGIKRGGYVLRAQEGKLV